MDISTYPINYVLNLIPNVHVLLQVLLALLVIWILSKKKDPQGKVKLSVEEENKIISNWQPDPLIENVPRIHRGYDVRVVESKIGKYMTVNGNKCLNLSSHNFLGFFEDTEIEESAIKSIRKYGVGSCGPRGFYGTVDVHLELEERLAKFMGLEEAVVYSYGFSTVASAIPAYAKRGDIIFVDEEVNFAIQKGLDASRSEIRYFKHNNMEDLERLLLEQMQLDLKNKRKAEKTRRFLVVEGIYMKTGEICPLPELISLRKKYKLRIFIDESISFGTLGKSGKGVTDHFNVPTEDVDLIMASLECSIGSVGGFCVGSCFIVEHQRLSGLGYCFSASLPPLLTTAAIKAIDIIENNPQLVNELQVVCKCFHHLILSNKILMNYFYLVGDVLSPLKHLRLISDENNHDQLESIVLECEKRRLAVTVSAYLDTEKIVCMPSIKISLNRLLTESDMIEAVSVLEESVKSI